MFGDLPAFGDEAGTQGAGELEALVALLLDLFAGEVDEFVDGPGLLEAVLAAEVAGLEVHLLAGGAHHGCLLAAARAPAREVPLHS